MKLTITRPVNGSLNGSQGTFSDAVLELDDGTTWAFKAGELRWIDDAFNISRVPKGSYLAIPVASAHFGRTVYQLQDVPGPTPGTWRQACEIHMGNYCGDTRLGYRSDVEGCTIVGDSIGTLDPGPGFNGPQTAILNSVATLDKLMALTKGENLTVVYEDAPQLWT